MLKQVLVCAVLVILFAVVSAGQCGCCDLGRCRCCESQRTPCCDWAGLFRCLGKPMPSMASLPVAAAAAATLSDDERDVLEFDEPESLFAHSLEAKTERMMYQQEMYMDQLDSGDGGGSYYQPSYVEPAPAYTPPSVLTCYVNCADFAVAFGSEGIPVCSKCSYTITHNYVVYDPNTHQPQRCIDLDYVRDLVNSGDNTLVEQFRAQCQANSCSCQPTSTVASSLVYGGFVSPRTYLYDPYGECTSYKCRIMADGLENYQIAY